MDQQQIEKLRAAGYSDDDIRDFVANQPKLDNASTQTQEEILPEIDVTKPSDTLKQAEAAGIPTGARESSFISDVATAAPVVLAENAGKIGIGAGALGGLGALNMYKKGKALELEAERMRQAGIQNRFDQKLAQQAANQARAVGPVTPSATATPNYGNVRYNVPTSGAAPVVPQGPATAGPVVPNAGPAPMAQAAENAAARAPSLLDKTNSMIRQLAANKVVQGLSKGMTGLQMATYSPELGPKTPQVGRMRGMEINPLTNAPWTPDQIKQYESNPMMFDQQMAQPQMRR